MSTTISAAESTNQVHLPGILKNQRTLINIESLRRYVETVYNASDAEIRRDALVNALALATESVFEANSRFVEYATSAKSLLYALDAVKKRSDRAQEELARAARLFVQTEARLGVYAGEDRHEAMPSEDDARVSERVLAYCGKLRARNPSAGARPVRHPARKPPGYGKGPATPFRCRHGGP